AILLYLYISFFFQAEDGIRDRNVTGVQTCALPIFCNSFINAASPVKSVDLKTINALTILPLTSCGSATTAHSLTEGCFNNASSTSNGRIVYPELTIMSSDLPSNEYHLYLSLAAQSPVT